MSFGNIKEIKKLVSDFKKLISKFNKACGGISKELKHFTEGFKKSFAAKDFSHFIESLHDTLNTFNQIAKRVLSEISTKEGAAPEAPTKET